MPAGGYWQGGHEQLRLLAGLDERADDTGRAQIEVQPDQVGIEPDRSRKHDRVAVDAGLQHHLHVLRPCGECSASITSTS